MKNFVILSDKRTGSTFLQESLNSHPDIKCFDELFIVRGSKSGKRRGQLLYKGYIKNNKKSIKEYIEYIYNQDPDKSTGFRLMFPQDDYWKALSTIVKMDIPIIYLKRKNLFKLIMSKLTKKVDPNKKLILEPAEIIKTIKSHEEKNKRFDNILKNYKNILKLNYENIIGSTEGDITNVKKYGAFNLISDQKTFLNEKVNLQICKFLDIKNEKLFSNITKRSKKNVWEYIKNDNVIKKSLNKNGYGDFI